MDSDTSSLHTKVLFSAISGILALGLGVGAGSWLYLKTSPLKLSNSPQRAVFLPFLSKKTPAPTPAPAPTLPPNMAFLSFEKKDEGKNKIATLVLDSKESKVQAFQTVLRFNPQKTKIVGLEETDDFPDLFYKVVDQAKGTITLASAIGENGESVLGKGEIVKITFRSQETNPFSFEPDKTIVASFGKAVQFVLPSG